MHVEIFLAVMVLAVAMLVAADFFRRTSEGPHEHAERPAYDAGREAFTPPRAAAVTVFEPARTGRPGPAGNGRAARPGPARQPAETRETGGGAAARTASPGPRGRWLVRTRLSLLAAVSAVAAALATASVIRAAGVLQGASYHSGVSSIRDGAAISAILAAFVAVAALAVGGWSAAVLIRSVLRPLHRLRAGAVELAEVRLPDALRGDGRGPLAVRSVGVSSSDEIGEIGRALDQVQAEVLGLTSNETGLRGKLGEMFVELSTRSRALVERQIRLIDELEQGERDSERLASLFKMDHIATRMRRYSQNLLVLAGHELPGRWSQPVTLVDVIRAAVSEIEDYERVSLSAQPGIAVSGPAVSDVVHLIAELTENAASLSAAGTPVDVSGRTLASGGVLVEITDQGVGMNPEVLAEANRRLENPPAMDLAVSRNMGLFVVGRLAARHGVKVRLQPAAAGGLTAQVWLPDAVAGQQHDAAAFPGGFGDAGPGWGAHGAGRSGRPEPERVPVPDHGPALARSMHSAPVLEDVRPRSSALPAPASAPGTRQAPRHAWPDGAPRQFLRTQPPPASAVSAASAPADAGPDLTGPDLTGPDLAGPDLAGPDLAGPDLAGEPAEERRLPIYEAVESDWFGNRRKLPGGSGAAGGGWTTPADRGWRAAEAAAAPASSGTTTAGLPVRTPRANLVPGTIGAPPPDAAPPSRSASAIRDRLTGFQRGTSQGRAAVSRDDPEQAP